MKPHAIKYTHNGRECHLSLHADSFADAEARLASAVENGEAEEVTYSLDLGRGSNGQG